MFNQTPVTDAAKDGERPAQQAVDPASTTDTGAADTTIDWKVRFDGMKGTAQENAQKLAQTQAILGQTATQLEALRLQGEAEVATLSKERDDFKSQAETAKAEAEALKVWQAQSRVISKEYSQLMPFFDEGVLSLGNLTGEELTTKLKSLSSRLTTLNDAATGQESTGTVPPAPAPGSKETAQSTLADIALKVEAALRDHGIDSKEYKAALNDYSRAVIAKPA